MNRSNPTSAWNVLFAVSLLAIVGLAGFHFLAPKPISAKAIDADLKTIEGVSRQAKEKTAQVLKESASSTWDLDAERLGTRTLAVLTDLTDKHKLKLSAFRIERAQEVLGIQEATYVAVVEGPFPAITEVLKILEDPQSKLVVSLFQVSSSDPDSDKVTATIGLVGFIPAKSDKGTAVASTPAGGKS